MTQCIYICSAGHSGSTLLDLMLGSHDEVESLGEIIQFNKNYALNTECTCGSKVQDCELWSGVVDDIVAAGWRDYRQNPYKFPLGDHLARDIIDPAHQTTLYRLRRMLRRSLVRQALAISLPGVAGRLQGAASDNSHFLYERVAARSGRPVVVDSSKDYLRAVNLYNRFPDHVRIVLLSRDGRGVLYSNMKRGVSRRKSLVSWLRYYRNSLPLLGRYVSEPHLYRLRYEDMVADPAAALAGICERFGLAYSSAMLRFDDRVHHITNGNNMRFSRGTGIRLDETWKRELGRDDLDYFDRVGALINAKLGYGN